MADAELERLKREQQQAYDLWQEHKRYVSGLFEQREALNNQIDWYSGEIDRLSGRISSKEQEMSGLRASRDRSNGTWIRMLAVDLRDLKSSRRTTAETRRNLAAQRKALNEQIKQARENSNLAREAFNRAKEATARQRTTLGQWQDGGRVNKAPAKTKEHASGRIDAIWGGKRGNTQGDGHGHLVSKDGVNAEFLREPGGHVIYDKKLLDPHEEYYDPGH